MLTSFTLPPMLLVIMGCDQVLSDTWWLKSQRTSMAKSSSSLSDMKSFRYSSVQTVVCRYGAHKTGVPRTRFTLGGDVVEPYLIRMLPIHISDLSGLTNRSFLSMKGTSTRISVSSSSITIPSKWHVVPLLSCINLSPDHTEGGGAIGMLSGLGCVRDPCTYAPGSGKSNHLTGDPTVHDDPHWVMVREHDIRRLISPYTTRGCGHISPSRCCSSKVSVSLWTSSSRMFRIYRTLTIYRLSKSGR